ncbi:MAG: ChaN family lipoprotein [Thermodesulfobacteriota bacterium]
MKNRIRRSLNRSLLIFVLVLPNAAYTADFSGKSLPDYTLEVSFDIRTSLIKGLATIPVKRGQELHLDKGELKILHVTLDKKPVDVSGQKAILKILAPRDGTIEIDYEGTFMEVSPGLHGPEPASTISGRGIFLTGAWYPRPQELCHYHLTAVLPQGYEAVSEAEMIEKRARGRQTVFTFGFSHPVDGINLIATDRYTVVRDHFEGIEVIAYFFREDADLIPIYLKQTQRYLKLYAPMIGSFPYRRFSIVENFLPTGYSMPTFTLLGQQVIRLPFIPETSLGHEILHQWFGNLVYIDYENGNWAEGLTSFLADHLYQEMKNHGFEYRKGALINYQSYVSDKNEFPLRDFGSKTDNVSEAIGYGKALMVFQMLREMVGEKRFYESIRHFTAEMAWRKASWNDLKRAFERYYAEDLTWFFTQWIEEEGLPEILLEDAEVRPSGSKFEVAFTVVQKKKVYSLDLPVTIYSNTGKAKRRFRLHKEKERLKMTVEGLPVRMAVDEDYDVARKLAPDEFPPVIARLLGEERPILVLPPSGTETYDEIVEAFKERGGWESKPSRVTLEDLKTHSLVILGKENPLIASLYGDLIAEGGFSLVIKENPWNRWKVAGIFDARSKGEVSAAFPKIFHYGRYSALSFDHGANLSKKADETERGMVTELREEAVAVEISTLKPLQAMMDHVADKKIIYVGETHDQFSHHAMQLEIIQDLHRRGKKVAVGMEMFQKPFQKVVDEYIEGKIEERAFLKGTEYFKRWGFDYQLYRPILQLAREERIPVVALNQRQEVVDRVFQSGLDSLSEEEKKSLPIQMDFSDDAYRERLRKVFGEHKDSKAKNFDYFCQAQILWDETMAESVDQFLRTHPDHQMVVLAGSGHLEYGSGIPRRVARRNGYGHAIILNHTDLEKGIADFVLFPGAVAGIASPRLMVFLKEEEGKVEITEFPHGSASEKAGMKVGDRILAIDNSPVSSIDDVKIELLSKKKGDKAAVRVQRKGLLGAGTEMSVEVILQ